MAKKKTRATKSRSAKAGRPPAAKPATRPQVGRRMRCATVAVKKDTTLLQTDAGTKVLWGANQKRPSKT